MRAVFAFDRQVGQVLIALGFIQAQKEDAARLEIGRDVVDDVADVDVSAGGDVAVNDVFLSGGHGGKYRGCRYFFSSSAATLKASL